MTTTQAQTQPPLIFTREQRIAIEEAKVHLNTLESVFSDQFGVYWSSRTKFYALQFDIVGPAMLIWDETRCDVFFDRLKTGNDKRPRMVFASPDPFSVFLEAYTDGQSQLQVGRGMFPHHILSEARSVMGTEHVSRLTDPAVNAFTWLNDRKYRTMTRTKGSRKTSALLKRSTMVHAMVFP